MLKTYDMTRRKGRPTKKSKIMSTPSTEILELVTSTPIEQKSDPKRKRDETSSISTTADSFMLDLESDSIKMKIQHIIEESVKVATDAAIQAAKTMIQTGLEAIFNHKIDILESRIFDLEKRSDKQFEINESLTKELLDLKSEVKTRDTRISSLQNKLGQAQEDLKKCLFQNNDNAQYTRKNTVRIFGVEQRDFKNENVYDIIQNIFSEKLNLPNIDVEVAHRVGPVKTTAGTINKTRAIICKMLRRTDKIKVISTRRKLKGQKISISEELTKSNFLLLKKLQEHNLIEQAWSHNGKMFAKNKTNVIRRITDINAIHDIFA